MKKFFEGFPPSAHPMTVLSSMVNSLSAYYPESELEEDQYLNMIRLLAKLKTIAAFSYKKSIGQAYVYPQNNLSYCADLIHMLFAVPSAQYDVPKVLEDALDLLLILHADHEQNCSTSTVRMVGSSEANLFASIAAGINALSGALHGGANQHVIQMLQMIKDDNGNYKKYLEMAKDKESKFKLMGFGHRVYKNFDPRAKIVKASADKVLNELGVNDPLLNIARNLEEIALKDDFFIERKLYPNVDFYSGIIYRAMGIPTNMFTVMFALGRLPGWIAQWKEMKEEPHGRIYRPRQIYIGETKRAYVPIGKR
jgi:citrate synthase